MCEADGEADSQGVGASRLLEDEEVAMIAEVHLPADMIVWDQEGQTGAIVSDPLTKALLPAAAGGPCRYHLKCQACEEGIAIPWPQLPGVYECQGCGQVAQAILLAEN